MPAPRLLLDRTALLVVDLQDRLVPHMHDPPALLAQAGRLIDGANVLRLPILVTEQYRKGLGATVPELAGKLGGAACSDDKLLFSACTEPIRAELAKRAIRSVIVCGVEAHVCVLQTCLDLIDAGYVTALAVDAIGSRRASDRDAAVQRMIQAGVVPTTVESALFELVREAGTPTFKAMLPVVK